jgi:purine-binding chemotaxis protein CheW
MDISEIRKKARELREKAEGEARRGAKGEVKTSSPAPPPPPPPVSTEAGAVAEAGIESGIEAGVRGGQAETGAGVVKPALDAEKRAETAPEEEVSGPAIEPEPDAEGVPGQIGDIPEAGPPGPGGVEAEAESEEAGKVHEPHLEAVSFMLDNEEYAIDISRIKEVIRARELTDVPRAPADILGVLSLRGSTVPIMNLRARLGLTESRGGKLIIIVRDEDEVLGFLVDSVKRVVRVPVSSLEPAPSLKTRGGELIKAVGRADDESFILLQMDKVLEEL